MSTLTTAEASELATLWRAWNDARARRDYAAADPLRAQLMEWGATGAALDRWHPVFESTAHREARLVRRAGVTA